MLRTAAEHTTVSDALESYESALGEIPHFLIALVTHPPFYVLLGAFVVTFLIMVVAGNITSTKLIENLLVFLVLLGSVFSFIMIPVSLGLTSRTLLDMADDAEAALHDDLADIVAANYEVEDVEPRYISFDENEHENTVEIDRVTFEITSDNNLNAAEITMTQNDTLDMLIPVSKDNDILTIREGSLLDAAQQN